MRPKVVLGVLLGILLTTVLALVSTKPGSTAPQNQIESAVMESIPGQPSIAAPLFDSASAPGTNDMARLRFVEQRTRELQKLSARSDQESREAIMADLHHSDSDIRAAALEAIIQFSDRSVVPRLEELAANTDDPAEKKRIVDAVEYIKLPSMTEYMAQRKARQEQLAAQGITNAAKPKRPLLKAGPAAGTSASLRGLTSTETALPPVEAAAPAPAGTSAEASP